MQHQPAFSLEPDRPAKRVTETSIQAYREIAPSLPKREAAVLNAMQWHSYYAGFAFPTAYELFEQMRRRGLATDLNSVRPRLTALEQRGLIEKGEKRTCTVTGKTAFTWVVKE